MEKTLFAGSGGDSDSYDVVIIGAGISGISAAVHLQERCPDKRYLILEARDAIGGTWDLFRYPGVRSDSDMHTLGFRFKPWTEAKAIADGPSIRRYVNATADEWGVRQHIRFGHKVRSANWNSADAEWVLTVATPDGDTTVRAQFLSACGGYYRYAEGFDPKIPNVEQFTGDVLHPQAWPEDYDYTGKRVVVIGSGATAMTIVPAMADRAAHVTMVQRSPTYVVSRPDEDRVANGLRRYLPNKLAYAITRFKNIEAQRWIYRRTRVQPQKVRNKLLDLVRRQLPDFDVDTHFTPSYNPWDQRLCLIPNADLFKAIRGGKVSVVTDPAERFTERGLKLASGEELDADVIVTATGLQLEVLSGISVQVDERPVDFAETYTYKGMMFSGVPNLVQTFGYINASWTLRADLTSEFICRVLTHLDRTGNRQCTPRLRANEQSMGQRPWIEDFSSGYMQRDMHRFPKQGDHEPWVNTQNFHKDRKMIRHAPIDDGVLVFDNPAHDTSRDSAPEVLESHAV